MPRGTRRGHTRTTNTGRTVRVSRAKIRKGRDRTGSSSSRGRAASQRDPLYAAWAAAGGAAYAGLVHHQWVTMAICGIVAVVLGLLYLGKRAGGGSSKGRLGRAKRKIARNRSRRQRRQTLRQVLSTMRQPASIEHRLMDPRDATKEMRRKVWTTLAPPERPPTKDRPDVRFEPPPWSDRGPRPVSETRPAVEGARTLSMSEAGDGWRWGDQVCVKHGTGFDPDCPTCLALWR